MYERLVRCFLAQRPGTNAHLEMAPLYRRDEIIKAEDIEKATRSSVLIAFYLKNEDFHIVFIQRQIYAGTHSGQISFPGGKWEPQDKDMYTTALREAKEEIGLRPENCKLAGKLTDLYIPPSNYIVSPYVVVYQKVDDFIPDPFEVSSIIEIPFSFFETAQCRHHVSVKIRAGFSIDVPCFMFDNHVIWGATAMILNELIWMWNSTV